MAQLGFEGVRSIIADKLKRSGRLRHISMEEVRAHNQEESGWIVVDKFVYDITGHIKEQRENKPIKASTILAILRTLGTDCTEEVLALHSELALKQIQAYMIGTVDGNDGRMLNGDEVAPRAQKVEHIRHPTPGSESKCPFHQTI
jgi:nitrate reductase (NAD(P)H)